MCAAYHEHCTVNRPGTACQEKRTTCEEYTTEVMCTVSGNANTTKRCLWIYVDGCHSVTDETIHYCAYIVWNYPFQLTDAMCASYHKKCTRDLNGERCQERKATCMDYTSESSCS